MEGKIIKTKDGRTFYIGKDSTSDLQHWKYIKRERVNGKWRYYYKDDDYENARKKTGEAIENRKQIDEEWTKSALLESDLRDQLKKAEQQVKELEKLAAEQDKYKAPLKLAREKAEVFREKFMAQKEATDELGKPRIDAHMNEAEAKKEVHSAANKDLSKKSMSRKLVKSLNKASDAIDNAKQFVKSLFD